ncbi:MAG: hypothetical protein DRN27_02860 [Thermoplasmata archaeon]|nr:MAG: hypothetical protein DRN27_02860 [Thermoplasmata archaeon]
MIGQGFKGREKMMKRNVVLKKTQSFLITSIVILIAFFPIINIQRVLANPTIRYVSDGANLQDAINNSVDGDIVQINSSITLSDYIEINKSITIKGNSSVAVFVDGSGTFGFNVTKDNVTIDNNLIIYNCSTAIYIYNISQVLENITISNITIHNCSGYGVFLKSSSNNTVYNCFINDTVAAINITMDSDDNSIRENSFNRNNISIYISSSDDNEIYNNTFLDSDLFHAYDNSDNSWNLSTYGNYWDDYNSTDSNSDGIGNIYYNITGGSNKDYTPRGFFIPIVGFTYTSGDLSTSDTITFTDSSTDPNDVNSLTFSWDFGDSSTSASQNPSHQYSDDGAYKVSLTVTNMYQQSNITNETVIIQNVAPSADFTFSPAIGIVDQAVSFSDSSSDNDGSISSYFWDFGDSSNSTSQNPSHTFTSESSFTVILNVTDDDGDYSIKEKTITISDRPSADFTFSPSSGSTSDTITFNDTSTDNDNISSWSWDFGDNSTAATTQNTTHSFSSKGTFNVTLNVTDGDGVSNEKIKQITIINSDPTSDFSASLNNATRPYTVTFTDKSSDSDGSIANYSWVFGGDETNISTNSTVSHTFSGNGSYSISLTVTDNDGGTDEKNITIDVSSILPKPNFCFYPADPSVDETVWFNYSSIYQDGCISNWSWVLEDGARFYTKNMNHIFSAHKTQNVTLTVTYNNGFTQNKTKKIVLKKTYTNLINNSNSSKTFDYKTEMDTVFRVKTSNTSNITIDHYTSIPNSINNSINSYVPFGDCVNITLQNLSRLSWINLSFYYTQQDIKNINESSIKVFYWNVSDEKWVGIDTTLISLNSTNHSGIARINISHLTLFMLAGKIIQETMEENTTGVLPEIIVSLNTSYNSSNPYLTISYSAIASIRNATLNNNSINVSTIDNITFIFSYDETLKNGNYTLSFTTFNGSSFRNYSFIFNINCSNKSSISESISMGEIIFIFIILFILFLVFIKTEGFLIFSRYFNDKNKHLLSLSPFGSKTHTEGLTTSLSNTFNELNDLVFGNDDPWKMFDVSMNGICYNIDLFVEKPDAFVQIQNDLMFTDSDCKKIVEILKNDPVSATNLKIKTSLSIDQLSQSLTGLIKYGLVYVDNDEIFKLTEHAIKLIKSEKKE